MAGNSHETPSEEKKLDLREMGAGDPNDHWYYRHKSGMILRAIKKHTQTYSPVIDVGSGSGYFAQQVKKNFGAGKIFCVDSNYSETQIGCHGGIEYRINPPPDGANLYLFIDVLEHVEDPAALLTEYASSSNPGAVFVITVPAFMSLWSPHDVYLGHFRRYTLDELEALACKCGMEILEANYLFAPIFPLVYIYRKIFKNREPSSDLKASSPMTNSLLGLILKLDLIMKGNRTCGTSALVVARLFEN